MDVCTTLLVITTVLGVLVLIVAAIYAYIYYTQITPRRRVPHEDRFAIPQNTAQTDPEERRLFHPFMILSYAGRWKKGADPDN